jgi:hypothetical protein
LSAHHTAAVVHTAAPHTTSVGTTSASLRIFDVSYLVVCIIRISNVHYKSTTELIYGAA